MWHEGQKLTASSKKYSASNSSGVRKPLAIGIRPSEMNGSTAVPQTRHGRALQGLAASAAGLTADISQCSQLTDRVRVEQTRRSVEHVLIADLAAKPGAFLRSATSGPFEEPGDQLPNRRG